MDSQSDADPPHGDAAREFPCTETPPGVCEALADPIVQALMRADRVDPRHVAFLMRRTAARLAQLRERGGRP